MCVNSLKCGCAGARDVGSEEKSLHNGQADVTVSLDQLGALGEELGRGGQASVFALPGFSLADTQGDLVFKRYHTAPVSDGDLRRIVSVRSNLDPGRRQRLDDIATWPCRIVVDGTSTVGVVMPRIDPSYEDTLSLPSGKSKQSLREVLNLFVPVERVRKVGRPVPSGRQRLELCRDFAAALAFLHDELHIVFGDINAKNELWRLSSSPMVMFLDCDAVRPRGSVAATRQLNAPDWDPPEAGALNRSTDLYKLGLFILRALMPGDQGSTRRNPMTAAGVLDPEGQDMLVRALGHLPTARPTAREWTVHLSRMLGDPLDPPSLGITDLDRTFVLAGHPVEIKWTAVDATWVEVLRPGGAHRVDGRPGSGVVRLEMDQSGSLIVRAGNDNGVDERTIGSVTVVPIPVQRPLDVAMPRISWDTFALTRLPEISLPPLPVVGHGVMPPDAAGLVTSAPDIPRRPPVDPPPLRSAQFPLDLIGLVTAAPGFGLDPSERFEEWT
jgi:hypothetical protein